MFKVSRKIKLASVLRSPVCYLLQVGLQEDVNYPSSPYKYVLGLSNLLHGFVAFPLSLYYLSCWICWSDGPTSKEFLDHGSHAYGTWKGWRWRWGEMVPSLPSQSFSFSMQYQKIPSCLPLSSWFPIQFWVSKMTTQNRTVSPYTLPGLS